MLLINNNYERNRSAGCMSHLQEHKGVKLPIYHGTKKFEITCSIFVEFLLIEETA
jgi:hypothetical protein